MYGSSRYLVLRPPPGGSQHPQQLPQHFKQLKQVQQQDTPQQQHRMMHHRILKMMRLPTMMTAITGHLQNVAFMQLSQLEKAVFTLVILFSVSCTMSRLDKSCATPRKKASLTNSQAGGRSDLAMATSTEGISAVVSRCRQQFRRIED